MVLVYNSRTVKTMSQEIADAIQEADVPLSVYQNGYADLGPSNKSAIRRFANICTAIRKYELPIPPSPFIEFIVERTTGKSKQDFTGILDGKKGTGKSYSGSYLCGRYAIEIADKWEQDPKDYFSLNNCALLQDTEGVTKILDEADKYQAIMIDDAGIAIGSRDFATEKNKNLNKIMTICRTKRWFVMQNAPMSSHIDKQQRELMDMVSHIYKPFHKAEFNILKINSSESTFRFGKGHTFEKRFSFFNRKFDFWCAYSPEVLDPFKGFIEQYDKQRDDAATKLISEITLKEKERSTQVSARERKRRDAIKKHGDTIRTMMENKASARQITKRTGLTDHMINIVAAELGLK